MPIYKGTSRPDRIVGTDAADVIYGGHAGRVWNIEGDSLSSPALLAKWPDLLRQSDPEDFSAPINRFAHGGDKLDDMSVPTPSGSGEAYLLWGGANDIASGRLTPEKAYAELCSRWALARERGMATFAFTVIPNGNLSSVREAWREELNDLIRSDRARYDYLVDVAALPELQNPSDLTYFGSDHLHLTTAGHQLVADLVARTYRRQRDDRLNGGRGDDIIHGQDGRDVLNGGDGDDYLSGGKGADCLKGGAGKDVFVFDSPLDGTVDVIKDFQRGEIIRLSPQVFTDGLAAVAYDAVGGDLSYHGVKFAHFAETSKPALGDIHFLAF